MLTEEQLKRLNSEICREKVSVNPMVTLINASRRANLPFKDVMEHIITRALQDAHKSIGDAVNESPHVAQ